MSGTANLTSREESRKKWKDEVGEIPFGYDIHHVDRNPENNSLTNLMCVNRTIHTAIRAAITRGITAYKEDQKVPPLDRSWFIKTVRMLKGVSECILASDHHWQKKIRSLIEIAENDLGRSVSSLHERRK